MDCGNKRVQIVDPTTGSSRGSVVLGDGYWRGLAVYPDPALGLLLVVSDCKTHTVKVLDGSGSVVKSFGLGGAGSLAGQLYNPYYVAVHQTAPAVLLVSNDGSRRVDVFSWESTRHQYSIGADRLKDPRDLSVWSWRREAFVVVANCSNHTVDIFRLSGEYVRSVGAGAVGGHEMKNPFTLCIHQPAGGRDDQTLLIVGTNSDHRLFIFNLCTGDGLYVMGGGMGSAVGQLYWPKGIVVLRSEAGETHVVVSEYNNDRLSIFCLETRSHVRTIGGAGAGAHQAQFFGPWAMAMLPGY